MTAAATLWLGQRYDFLQVSPAVLRAARWLAIAGLLGYALARRSLTISILVSIVVGAEIGHDWPGFAIHLRVLSLIFLRLIKTIIAPLLFGTLVVGIAGHANLKKVGLMGVKALIYFEVVTTLALLIGLAAINISKAGVGVAIAYTLAQTGMGVLVNLIELLVTLYAALIAFLLLVLLPVALLARVPLRKFVRAVAEPVSIAFATTSSEAALPRAMEAMEAIGVPRPTGAFVMPAGYSFNLDGASLYLSLATVFVAQAAGIHLSFGQQLVILFTLMLTSKGVAGVPRASLVILLGTAASFHLPAEPIFLLLGVDALMDMARTSVNVVGNCLATVVIARWEGEFGTERPSPVVAESLAE